MILPLSIAISNDESGKVNDRTSISCPIVNDDELGPQDGIRWHSCKNLHSISGRVSLCRARILSITTEEY